jgi:hypothetical protein
VIGGLINDFRVHNHCAESDQVRDELAHLNTSKENRKSPLLVEGDAVELEENRQRIFVNLFIQAVPNFIQHFKCKPDDLLCFRLRYQL